MRLSSSRERESEDKRFVSIFPRQNIKQMLERVGYPFKSKEHSQRVYEWHHGSKDRPYMKRYLEKESFGCPKMLKYQFSDDFKLNISHKCCYELKKRPIDRYMKENGRFIRITGMMKEEGGNRTRIDCILKKNDKVVAFHPLAKVSKEWEDWFIQKYNIELCKLYYSPFNFERTGCRGCPYNLHLQEDLSVMDKYLPNERKACETIWKPVYEEYRRIGYRLKNEEQLKLL